MKAMSWVAAFALLAVLAVSSSALAEANLKAPQYNDPTKCYLHGGHYNALQKQINALAKAVKALRVKIVKLAKRPPARRKEAKLEGMITRERTRLTQFENQLSKLREKLQKAKRAPAPVRIVPDPLPKWAGWHWGTFLSVGAPGFTGAVSSHIPTITRLTVFGQWISRSHFGIEGGLSGGMWFTEDTAPFFLSGHLYGVVAGKTGAIFAGIEGNYLQSPLNGKPGYVLATVQGGGEVYFGPAFFRITFGVPTVSPLKRLSGLYGFISIGVRLSKIL